MKNLLIFRSLAFLLLGLGIVTIFGCNKLAQPDAKKATQEVSFTIKPGELLSGLKSTNVLPCFEVQADYVKVQVDDSLYKIDVFYINNIPYTNTIKLTVGVHTVKEFTLWSDNNTPTNFTDDVLLAATPHSGSTYAGFVVTPINIPFTIDEFKKLEFPIEVVCYEPDHYNDFGFTYFQINEIVVREETFFGDICIKNINDYVGSLYAQQSQGLQLDMPAIFKIEAYRNGVLTGSFNNEAWKGEGQPLKVTYGDNLHQLDAFEFKLYILVRKGTGFSYVYFHSWLFNDDQVIPQGSDGVVDFALGNCVPNADLIIPPWMNLPATCTYQITGSYAPGAHGGYVDATLTGIPSGYEIANSTVASWCADHETTINAGQTYGMDVYSSMYPTLLPAFAQSAKWPKINWILNHLDWYPGYLWDDVQGAIWLYDTPSWNGQAHGGVRALASMQWAQTMYNDAQLYGSNYKVPSGGWACIIFIPTGTLPNAPNPTIQTMFIRIDP